MFYFQTRIHGNRDIIETVLLLIICISLAVVLNESAYQSGINSFPHQIYTIIWWGPAWDGKRYGNGGTGWEWYEVTFSRFHSAWDGSGNSPRGIGLKHVVGWNRRACYMLFPGVNGAAQADVGWSGIAGNIFFYAALSNVAIDTAGNFLSPSWTSP